MWRDMPPARSTPLLTRLLLVLLLSLAHVTRSSTTEEEFALTTPSVGDVAGVVGAMNKALAGCNCTSSTSESAAALRPRSFSARASYGFTSMSWNHGKDEAHFEEKMAKAFDVAESKVVVTRVDFQAGRRRRLLQATSGTTTVDFSVGAAGVALTQDEAERVTAVLGGSVDAVMSALRKPPNALVADQIDVRSPPLLIVKMSVKVNASSEEGGGGAALADAVRSGSIAAAIQAEGVEVSELEGAGAKLPHDWDSPPPSPPTPPPSPPPPPPSPSPPPPSPPSPPLSVDAPATSSVARTCAASAAATAAVLVAAALDVFF